MEKEEAKQPPEGEGSEAEVPSSEAVSLEELTARLEEAEREREQFKRLLQRVQADFSNYRKRADEEQREQEQQANARLIMRLLPVLDDLELAMSQASQSSTGTAWLEGMRLIHRKVWSVLESEGVVAIEALDRPFDPFEHEAVTYQETDQAPEGTVVAVLRGGYKLHGRVLRAAQVAVAKAVSAKEEHNSPAQEEER